MKETKLLNDLNKAIHDEDYETVLHVYFECKKEFTKTFVKLWLTNRYELGAHNDQVENQTKKV